MSDDEILSLSQSQSQEDDKDDEDYFPPSNSDSSMISGCSEDTDQEKAKVIVYLKLLLDLLKICRVVGCGSMVEREDMKIVTDGALITVTCVCLENHTTKWRSSPVFHEGTKHPVGEINIVLAAYILTCGMHVKQILEYFHHLNILCFARSFYFNLQRTVLHKAVWMAWIYNQEEVIESVKQQQADGKLVDFAGDGKFDSPGYSASFCTYVIQELLHKRIVAVWVAQKHMTSSSAAMEPFAAKRLLLELTLEHGLFLYSLTTDRSTSMKTMMCELNVMLIGVCPPILHWYDVWHMIKNIMKDVWDAGKLKKSSEINLWSASINNMLWWSFSSSKGDPVMLKEKVLSILDHVTNQHSFPTNTKHLKCAHEDLGLEQQRTKPFLKKSSPAAKKLGNALRGANKSRLEDLEMMTGFTHTGDIENFNSLNNKYANKKFVYGHEGMIVRGALTALDHNSNVNRKNATTADGSSRYNLVCSRDGKRWFVRIVKEKKTTVWRDGICTFILECMERNVSPNVTIPLGDELVRVRGRSERPGKAECVAKHQTRMALGGN